jgi:type IX secretion system PorP/SprF family membrane protein
MFLTAWGTLEAQIPTFRQQYTQRINANPAMIGMGVYNGGQMGRAAMTTRAQWLSQEGRLLTQSAGYDSKIKNTMASWAAGITATDLYSGMAGSAKYSHFIGSAAYAYEIPGRKVSARFGLITQFSNYSFGTGRYTWEDQVDQNFTGFILPTQEQEPNSTLVRNAFHVGAGAMLYNDKFYSGLSVYNLNQPDIAIIPGSESKLLTKYQFIAGYVLDNVLENATITPHLLVMQQEGLNSSTINALFTINNLQFSTGVQRTQWYDKRNVAMTNYVGYHYGKINIGYSLDWNLTYSTGAIPMTHEISLVWFTNAAEPKRKMHQAHLPEF